MNRRAFLAGAGLLAIARPAVANVPVPYAVDATPPRASREGFIDWMVKNSRRGPGSSSASATIAICSSSRITTSGTQADKRAFLMTPREEFVTAENLDARL